MTKDLVEKEVQLYMSDISSKEKTFLKSESWDKSFGEKGNSKKKKEKKHLKKVYEGFHKCDTCDKYFGRKSNKESHHKTVHENIKTY